MVASDQENRVPHRGAAVQTPSLRCVHQELPGSFVEDITSVLIADNQAARDEVRRGPVLDFLWEVVEDAAVLHRIFSRPKLNGLVVRRVTSSKDQYSWG